MSAFDKNADLPASVNTVEKLACWSINVLNDLYLNQTAIEDSSGNNPRQFQMTPFLVNAGQAATWRLVVRASFALDNTWRRTKQGVWVYAGEAGQLAIPVEYKS